MSNEINGLARADFQRARFKAFMNRVWATLSGQPSTLLSYDEIKEKLHIGGPIYRGVKTVRVDQIAGSLNRYHEFDRVFLPASDKLAAEMPVSRPAVSQALKVLKEAGLVHVQPRAQQRELLRPLTPDACGRPVLARPAASLSGEAARNVAANPGSHLFPSMAPPVESDSGLLPAALGSDEVENRTRCGVP